MGASHLSGVKARQSTQAVDFSLRWDVGLFLATSQLRPALAVKGISSAPAVSAIKEVTLVPWKNGAMSEELILPSSA